MIISFLLVPVLINIFYVYLVLFGVAGLFLGGGYSNEILLSLAFAIVVSLSLSFWFSYRMVVFIKRLRSPTIQEHQRLQSLLPRILEKMNLSYNTSYWMNDFKFKLSPTREIEYFAIARDNLVFSEGGLDLLNDNQLQAIIAHCIGGIYLRYGYKFLLLWGNSLISVGLWKLVLRVSYCFRMVYRLLNKFNWVVAKLFLVVAGGVGLFVFPFLIVIWLFYVLNLLSEALFTKQQILAGDKFVASVDLTAELIQVLELTNLNYLSLSKQDNFIFRYLHNQYSPVKRINRFIASC